MQAAHLSVKKVDHFAIKPSTKLAGLINTYFSPGHFLGISRLPMGRHFLRQKKARL